MKQYLDLVRTVLNTGSWQDNRTIAELTVFIQTNREQSDMIVSGRAI